VISQAVNDATIIEDSREMRRPGLAGRSDLALPATPQARAADPVLPTVLTPDELAKMLRVRRRSVYEAISRGDIPGVRRIGRKVRIDRDSVLAWMADGHGRAPRSSRR
jgi:excisionase family DNA binding protein